MIATAGIGAFWPPAGSYVVALLAPCAGALIREALGAEFPELVPYALYFPAVLLAAVLGGVGPGLVAILVSLIWAVRLGPEAATAWINLALFTVTCCALVAIAEAARRYQWRTLESEGRLRAAETLAEDGLGILAPDGGAGLRWRYVNPLLARLLAGDQPAGAAAPPLAGAVLAEGQAVLAKGERASVEVALELAGARRWFEAVLAPLGGEVTVLVRDVTERKARDEALGESEERFRRLADAIDEVFWIIDLRAGRMLYVSPAYERLWGVSAEALRRDPKAWRALILPDARAAVEASLDAMLAGERERLELVYPIRDGHGQLRWLRDRAWRDRSGGQDRMFGVSSDITAERAAAERQQLVAHELGHRLKNSLALVQSVLRLSARKATSLDEFVAGFDQRLQALAQSQDSLLDGGPAAGGLAEIVSTVLAPYRTGERRILIDGPPVQVAATAVPVMHMACHELATNAAKYGALAVPGGRVEVSWQSDGQPPAWLLLRWQEANGPSVRPPASAGFGSTMIEQVVALEFQGEVRLAFPPEGLCCTMRLPLSDKLMLAA